ncbi:MAG: hypothetical protein JOY64_36760 [Alphaproteobacteria bacterium]|nr:hypothetical protein [Alphaproteobacteria bacterium]MBV8413223.1 hypothetical protein [Alphaproteobacteria bacterium]
MTISVPGTVTGMRSNTLVTMDIEQLRGWSAFLDRAVVVSLVVAVAAVAALGITTWLSSRVGGAVRAREHVAFLQYKAETGKRAAELEQEVSTARERIVELERAANAADTRAAEATRESAAASAKARSAEVDAEEVRKRVAELGKAVMEARARAADPAPVTAQPPQPKEQAAAPENAAPSQAAPPPATSPPPTSPPSSPFLASLKKYAGTKAAVYVLDEARDAPAIGLAISGYLGEAGWAPSTWTWTGVSGILGVVVLIKEGSDPATNEAASAIVDALRSVGFNAAKGDWPANWSRYRGTLNGPETPSPTEAPIRIVIGSKAR